MKRVSKEELEGLRNSTLFDEKWYLEQYPDVKMLGMDPFEHYLWVGMKLGRKPSADHPSEETTSASDPVTNPYHDVQYFAVRHDVERSGLWDERWYLSQYYVQYRNFQKSHRETICLAPIDHYLQEGWHLGFEPSNLLPIDIDQAKLGKNKVSHFLDTVRFNGYHFDRNIWVPSPRHIADYLSQKQSRVAKKVVYTCIVDHYNDLMQPYHICNEWDYVCFTNDADLIETKTDGVWDIRPLSNYATDPTQANRWHKMHPHLLFPDYRESLYVDGNINIISGYIFDEICQRDLSILLPQHFCRSCSYDEIDALLSSNRFSSREKIQFQRCHDFLRSEAFPEGVGLTENNLIYRKHHEKAVVGLMKEWWEAYSEHPPRDQTTLAYVFWKNGLSISQYTFANCRVNYRDFWIVKHNTFTANICKRAADRAIIPVFGSNNVAVVFSTNEQFVPYLGVAIYSLIKNRGEHHNYDIVILGNGLSDKAQASICVLANGCSNVSIRFYDMGEIFSNLPKDIFHVEGYVPVETYNKCFITEILSGYDRCVYLDSDIVVLDDVQKLHDTQLDGCAIAASINVANVNAAYCQKEIKGRRFDSYLKNELGLDSAEQYFQAGVLVLDLVALRTMNLTAMSIECLRQVKEPIFFDQCIFNRILRGNVKYISTEWNHVWYMQNYSYLRGSVPDKVFYDYARGRIDPKIVHFASKDKPHTKAGWKLGNIFWMYAYETPFIGEILHQLREADNEVTRNMLGAKGNDWYNIRPRVLIHIHLYYLDQIDLMLDLLENVVGCDFELFVTMVERDEAIERQIREVCGSANILVVPNAGYDVYPFLHVLNQIRLANFDFVLKMHTKNRREPGQDTVYGIQVPGYGWRDQLLNAIVGSKSVFNRNLAMLIDDKQVGCLGAREFIFSTKKNKEEVTYNLPEWREKCGVEGGHNYVGGSMFLARAYPFERLKALRMSPDEFSTSKMETKDYRNRAHVFERLLGIVVENEGFEIRGV